MATHLTPACELRRHKEGLGPIWFDDDVIRQAILKGLDSTTLSDQQIDQLQAKPGYLRALEEAEIERVARHLDGEHRRKLFA